MPDELLPITGTFLDEITWDIPSQSWGREEWRADFETMRSIGFDTLVIIRGGLARQTLFPSKVIGTNPPEDLAGFFLEEAAARNMKLFFGNYDSGDWAERDAWKEEIQINRRFMQEVFGRYGGMPAFGVSLLNTAPDFERNTASPSIRKTCWARFWVFHFW